jgi:hypothetical protein
MAKQIPLTKGHFAIVDNEDYNELMQWKWSYSGGYPVRKVQTSTGSKTYCMHRQIMQPPDGYVVDHIDGNRLNNQRCNLRLCTMAQNAINRRPNLSKHSSPYKGVYYHKRRIANPWMARIKHNDIDLHLGVFPTAEDAARAYNAASIELHGEFAWLNEVP